MKKFFMILGIVFLCVIIGAGIWVAVLAYEGIQLDKSSKVYVDEVTPIIIASWDPQELLNRASPELLEVTTPEKLRSVFKMVSEKLGPLKAYKGSEGDSRVEVFPSGKVITAKYRTQASFENGNAEIAVGLIQHDKKWQLLEFRVNSEAFLL